MPSKYKILISNVNFGKAFPKGLQELQNSALVIENSAGKKFTVEDFIAQDISTVDIIVAGTEKICSQVISAAKKLKLICRVGAGLDSVDLEAAFANNIQVVYTPDAPAMSVPEFTLAVILNLIKGIGIADRLMHEKQWCRYMGQSLRSCRVGIIGAGKIGKQVIKLLLAIEPTLKIVFYDPYVDFVDGAQKLEFNEIFRTSNIVSLHIPLNNLTKGIVSKTQLGYMPKGSYLINTSRGEVVDEEGLYYALQDNLAGAAIDVFANEPYSGILCDLQNCILTPHIGSMTVETRALMEQQILEDLINFINNRPLLRSFKYKQYARTT